MKLSAWFTSSTVLGFAMISGCTGMIGTTESGGESSPTDPGSDPGQDPGSQNPGAPDPGEAMVPFPVPAAPATCADSTFPVAGIPLRRLTQLEFNNTVVDLLGDPSLAGIALVGDTRVGPFDLNGTGVVTDLMAENYLDAAVTIADQAVLRLDQIYKCAVGSDETTCARDFIRTFGLRAFRRPLRPEEETLFQQTYASARGALALDFKGAIGAVMSSMLVSPGFHYLFEFGAGTATGGKLALGPYEIASRLSYFLWRSMPDAELFKAAADGRLATADEVAAQVRRMLDAPRARTGAWSFFQQWLELQNLDTAQRDPKLFPKFTPTLVKAMGAETEQFVNWVMNKGKGSVESLFGARQTFVGPELAAHYGIPAPASGQMASLDATERVGLLTQGAVLTAHARDREVTQILLRGKFVRTNVLCTEIPAPPANVPPLPAPTATSGTIRERLEAHTNISPLCQTCHHLINPIGYGLQNYDSIGAYRTTLEDAPVDSSGELTDTDDANGPFTGARELGERLSKSAQVRQCLADQFWTYAMAQLPGSIDDCVRDRAFRAFEGSGYDLKELIVAIASNETFRHLPEAN